MSRRQDRLKFAITVALLTANTALIVNGGAPWYTWPIVVTLAVIVAVDIITGPDRGRVR
jgi:fatty acid desaturase